MFSNDYKITIKLLGDEPLIIPVDICDINNILGDLEKNTDYLKIKQVIIPKTSILYLSYEKIEEEK